MGRYRLEWNGQFTESQTLLLKKAKNKKKNNKRICRDGFWN